jgi:hypothetical protein
MDEFLSAGETGDMLASLLYRFIRESYVPLVVSAITLVVRAC